MNTDPVLERFFFGREDVLQTLKKRSDAFQKGYRQNIGIVGEPFTGKSSILAQFLRQFSSPNVISILIRVQEVDSFQAFFQKWLGAYCADGNQTQPSRINPAFFHQLVSALDEPGSAIGFDFVRTIRAAVQYQDAVDAAFKGTQVKFRRK